MQDDTDMPASGATSPGDARPSPARAAADRLAAVTGSAPAAAPGSAPGDGAGEAGSDAAAGILRKKDLVAAVASAAGIRRSEARAAVDAALGEMGQALERGDTLRLAPLGVVKPQRRSENARATTLVTRIKRKKDKAEAKDPLDAREE